MYSEIQYFTIFFFFFRRQRVRLGEYDIKNTTDCVYNFGIPDCTDPIQRIDVEKIIVHEGFSYRNLDKVHDIALIKLKRSVKFTGK